MSRELGSLHDRSGKPLTAIARRFSAVDARYYKGLPNSEVIQPYYSLADQLFVQPDPLLDGSMSAQARRIQMTPQEVAVALSHVEVWKLISQSDRLYTLVLRGRRLFPSSFRPYHRRRLGRNSCSDLGQVSTVDMVYLSYKEADENIPKRPFSNLLFRPVTGLWQLSGYVLSRDRSAETP